MSALYVIVRLRGRVDVPPDVEATLKLLRLTRKYTAVIYPKTDSIDGMLDVVKDWVTWGEIQAETLKKLILERGRTVGNKPLNEERIKELFGMDVDELVNALIEGRIFWHKLEDKVKPVFRLHPPKGGFKRSIKKPLGSGGELGYRGEAINELINRMV
ncbi:MAG: 50S ribosomal protein L30 [Zestosphaera tikiterensis]|uniref:Large ribosomal subunit protein uL30 n=1 Tax=Zestosphaera tikiterensis TaxID=1973259 RepID=A0A2R7Y959_9CREN|nr:MAG: 50S ribosomal protein L30 [Zestosphaera tikiterensis]